MGICTSAGIIRDFAGPYFVSVSGMTLGLYCIIIVSVCPITVFIMSCFSNVPTINKCTIQLSPASPTMHRLLPFCAVTVAVIKQSVYCKEEFFKD